MGAIYILYIICAGLLPASSVATQNADFERKKDSPGKEIAAAKDETTFDTHKSLWIITRANAGILSEMYLATKAYTPGNIAENTHTRNYLFFALGGCSILTVALGIWFCYTRLVRRKNRSLYLRIQKLIHLEGEAKERLLNVPEEKLSREMQIFRRLSRYMQDEKPFIDPALNRKMLAARMNTNETYLADAIRETTGETVSSYISGLRLRYALMLLNEHPEMTLDTIAVDSGHGSYSPFFRSFTKKYGITPSEYRKMSAK
ncbi:MAG: helix-turn-helix domain-containing protein [Tannerella sp.]|jgi:AraC-like DNA-binding protein|nr:helix-turn-helix domain-containing protein [Tannerella sp.]